MSETLLGPIENVAAVLLHCCCKLSSQNTQTRVSFFLVSISSAHQMKLLCVWVGGGWGGVGGRGGGELGGDGRTMDDGRWTMAANLPVSRAATLDHHKHQHLHALRAVSSAQKQLFGK